MIRPHLYIMNKQQSRQRLRLTLKFVYFVPVVSLLLIGAFLFYFNLSSPQKAIAGTETITSGSFIINMGVVPQTVNNGLKPYGMVYDLMVNYSVPIKWVIEPSKSKDGTDFTFNAIPYKGGVFIVPKDKITSAVTTRITYWTGQGVQGVYTNADVSVPVYATITNWPKLIIDNVSGNDNIITNYFDNALIPSTGYSIGSPSGLTYCHDMWANPHGDPTWATHGYLYNLVTIAKSYIWMQCHAVSVTEGVRNSVAPFEQLNFLSTNGLKCYSSNKCGAGVTETHGNSNSPYTHYYPTDPIMQFMGTMDGACSGGSEQWYQPQSTGAWRSTTKRLVTSNDGVSPNEGILMAYGPAFGDVTNGYVMYEGGHNIAGNGSTAEKVAAQRAFFNFLLLAGINKQIVFNSQTSPSTLMGNQSGAVSVTVSSGSPGYTYAWTATVGGTFSSSTSASTNFTAAVTGTPASGNIICTVTDACGRKNFVSRPISVSTDVLPIELKNFDCGYKGNAVDVTWITASEINNDYFTIEHGTDGVNYEKIGQVRGSGNSTSDIAYKFTDKTPENGYNYYRLIQTDYDGTSKTYGPVYVKINNVFREFDIADVGPNPFQNRLSVGFNIDKPGLVTLTLLNSAGSIFRTEQIKSTAGFNSFEISNLDNLPAGIYYAMLITNGEKKIVKLLKN